VGQFAHCSSLNLLSKKKMGMTILGTLPARHTPNLMSHTSTLCMYVGNEVKSCFICKKGSTGLTSPFSSCTPNYPMFLLKDHVVLSFISSLTRHLLIAVCSAVNILLILTGIKHWKNQLLNLVQYFLQDFFLT
jgi:hypothetical protein